MKDARYRAGVALTVLAGLLMALAGAGEVTAQRRSTVVSIEFENLVSAKPSGGQLMRQEMASFGPGWSGNAQLFWAAPPPVDAPIRNWPHVSFSFIAPVDGVYDLVLRHTVAPDFGQFRVFIDGAPAGDVDGYATAVAPRTRQLGTHTLKAGSHPIVITVFSKSAASKGYAVGLDRLDLRPNAADAPTTPGGHEDMSPLVAHGDPGVHLVNLDPGRRLAEPVALTDQARVSQSDATRLAAAKSVGGIFADVHQVESTLRWTPDAPVIPGRGYMGGSDIFVGAPEPLTIALRGDNKSTVRLVAKGLGPTLYLLTCGMRLKAATTIVLYQIGPAVQHPGQVPASKLLEVTPNAAALGDQPYVLVAAFKLSAPGTYGFQLNAISGKGVNETLNWIEISFCELSAMS